MNHLKFELEQLYHRALEKEPLLNPEEHQIYMTREPYDDWLKYKGKPKYKGFDCVRLIVQSNERLILIMPKPWTR